jgi:hypothetical protein
MRRLLLFMTLLLTACGSVTDAVGCAAPLPADKTGSGVACGSGGQVAESIATDLRTYHPGQAIKITVTATNVSTLPCTAPTACGPLPVQVVDWTGARVWSTAVRGIVCPALARLLRPGETATYPQLMTKSDLKAGVYQATGLDGQPSAYGASFFRVC